MTSIIKNKMDNKFTKYADAYTWMKNIQVKNLFEKLGVNTSYYEAKIGHKMNKETYGKIKQWLFTLVDE